MDYIRIMERICLPDFPDYKYQANVSIVRASEEAIREAEERPPSATECMVIFRERYNHGELKSFSYIKYVRNKDLQQLVKELELDRDKFWILIIFLVDYCKSMFLWGETMKDNPFEQLEQLISFIDEHADDMTLNVKAGKAKASVTDPHALRFIAEALFKNIKETDKETNRYLSRRVKKEQDVILSDSPLIAFFINKLLRFFDTQPQIREKRKKGAKHSMKETDLICQAIYTTKLSNSDCWQFRNNENIKAFVRQYKDYKYPKNVSGVYPEFVP